MRPPPMTPDALRLGQVLKRTEPVERLLARLRLAEERFRMLRGELPRPLAAHVRPVPSDEDALTLIADTPSAAAKLRQMVPRFEEMLAARGDVAVEVRIRLKAR